MRRARLFALCLLALMGGLNSSVLAGPVELVSKDGYLTFEGDLIDVANKMYVVKTSVGVVRIPVADVICKGEGCPGLSARKVDKAPPQAASNAAPKAQSKLSGDWQAELFKDYRKNELFKEFLEWREKNPN